MDDEIDLGVTVDAVLTAGQDFAISFWWACGAGTEAYYMFIFRKPADNGQIFAANQLDAGSGELYPQFYVYRTTTPTDRTLFPFIGAGTDWNHYVFQRRGVTFALWANGALVQEDTTAGNDRDFSGSSGFGLGGWGTYALGTMDDFRVYDRRLLAPEIAALGAMP